MLAASLEEQGRLRQEVVETRASLDDLISELETVTAQAAAARDEIARGVRLQIESHEMQVGVLEENLKLTDELAAVKRQQQEDFNK